MSDTTEHIVCIYYDPTTEYWKCKEAPDGGLLLYDPKNSIHYLRMLRPELNLPPYWEWNLDLGGRYIAFAKT